jgi:methyl-accepting chemotaxis protein
MAMTPAVYLQIIDERKALEVAAKRQAAAALDMPAAVHVNAMRFRRDTADFDPAVDTLNGALAQFSEENKDVKLWLVVSQKVVDYQVLNGQTEVEPPLDEVDRLALVGLKPQTRNIPNDALRVTRPVILGEGSAAHPKCAACHTDLMGIQRGEPIGAYRAEVDMTAALATLDKFSTRAILGGGGTVILTLLLIFLLLRAFVLRPVIALADAAERVGGGRLRRRVPRRPPARRFGRSRPFPQPAR